jgi:hypothetical protein
MKNKLFEEVLCGVTPEQQAKVKAYIDAIDLTIAFGEWILSNYQTVYTGISEKKWTDDSRNIFTTSELFKIFQNQK